LIYLSEIEYVRNVGTSINGAARKVGDHRTDSRNSIFQVCTSDLNIRKEAVEIFYCAWVYS
jgi:hypothetical protein